MLGSEQYARAAILSRGTVPCAARGGSSGRAAPRVRRGTPAPSDSPRAPPYDCQLQASGGQAPYAWNVTGGTLPDGLQLDPATGRLLGTPAGVGRRPASQVRNVSTATPRAVAHSAWDRCSRVRISRRTEVHAAIGHDDAIGPPPTGSEWTATRIRVWWMPQKWVRNREKYFSW
jgi:Putative Ig domain